MKTRPFGNTGRNVSAVGFGAWAIGASWGHVAEEDALAALHATLDSGVTFIDTADVYGDGRSEKLIARAVRERGGERPFIATKAGRRLPEQTVGGYTPENLDRWIGRSLENLETDRLDLVQLHCPPSDLYRQRDVFDALDAIRADGRIAAWGVSIERVDEGMAALEQPNLSSIQVIYNIFRQRPAEQLFRAAAQRKVAIIARVPLASGLLSGKFRADTRFETDDHRNFNRNGEAFDVGETFSGVPYDTGLAAVEKIRPLIGDASDDGAMARFALRWILMDEAVTVVIPGARNAAQARSNAAADALPPLAPDTMAALRQIYTDDIAPHVHGRW